MPIRFAAGPEKFPELSYANGNQPRLTRGFIHFVEGLSGRDKFARLYGIWRREVADGRPGIFTRMLDLIDVRIDTAEQWPPREVPDSPLVIIANHPFGIGDGIAILSLAERLGRPFRVMIHADLLRIPEMAPYALAVDFSESKEALRRNLAVRHEAIRLLREGVTVVIFPAGGVATAPTPLASAEDLPWKMFVARLVLDAKASVIPIFFGGQNGRLFHLVSQPMKFAESDARLPRMVGKAAVTMRLSLLVREFARLAGSSIHTRIGACISWTDLAPMTDRKALLSRLQRAVLDLAPQTPVRGRPSRHAFGSRRPAFSRLLKALSGSRESRV